MRSREASAARAAPARSATPLGPALLQQLALGGKLRDVVAAHRFAQLHRGRRTGCGSESWGLDDSDPSGVAAASMELGNRCAATTSRQLCRRGRAAAAARGLGVSPSELAPPGLAEASRLRIGVLASQGDFRRARRDAASLGRRADRGPVAAGAPGSRGLVVPGGESTTIVKAIERDRLEPAIRAHFEEGRPILGTCAGMIVCDRDHLGLVDATGASQTPSDDRSRASEAELQVEGLGPDPLRAIFIGLLDRGAWPRGRGAGEHRRTSGRRA